MQKTIHFDIANPCSESWDQMTPQTHGRFCSSCQKTVVDFTSMTDEDLLHWFARHEGSVCGRLRQDQVRRPMVTLPEPRKNHWRYWNYLIAGLLLSSEVSAQTKAVPTPAGQYLPIHPEGHSLVGDTIMTPEKPPVTVQGRVVDSSGKPVSYATITFGPKQAVAADTEGYFKIPVAKLSRDQKLTVSAVGYETVSVNVDRLSLSNGVRMSPIVVPLQEVFAGGMVVVTHTRKRRKVLADTLSIFKDTLASVGLGRPALAAYPNPVARGTSLNLSVRCDQAGPYRVQLFNSSGALMGSMEVPSDHRAAPITMPIPVGLLPGVYFIKLSHPALTKCYTQEIMVF